MSCRIVDPGLPSWPALYVDRERGSAWVSARVTDWRAVERGGTAAKALYVPIAFCIGFASWYALTIRFGGIYGMLGLLGVMLVLGRIIPAVMDSTFSMFMARALFSRHLSVILTSKAVGFRSSYFRRGVKVDREFDGQAIQVAFVLRADPDAVERAASQKTAGSHLQDARHLELMVRGAPRKLQEFSGSVTRRIRSIPMASMRVDHGERFTVVLNAALELTGQSTFDAGGQAYANEGGRDLDINLALED